MGGLSARCATILRMRQFIAPFALLLVLASCGSDESGPSSPDDDAPADESVGEIVETGFGQNGQYAQGVAIFEHTADRAGQYVVVTMSALDEAGEIIQTEEQIDQIATPGQTIPILVWFDLGDESKTIASVDASVSFNDYDEDVDQPSYGTVEASEIYEEYGQASAKFPVINDTDEPIDGLHIHIVCRDAAGAINGGQFTTHESVPASGEVLIDTTITTSGMPATCNATLLPSPI